MTNAIATTAPAGTTIDPGEAAHFGRLAADWWDPRGSSAMLHRLNPVRLAYIRAAVDRYWGLDETARRPLEGRTAADVGCGGGLLTEPLARLGATVTGVDAARENIESARFHAAAQGLTIDYRVGDTSALGGRYDLVTSLEVIEHVTDPSAFIQGLAAALAPDGLLILSTPNRTALSRSLLVGIAEATGRIPRGTHDWNKFLTPEELTRHVEATGLTVTDVTGLSWNPLKGFQLSGNRSLNYLLTAHRP